MPGLRLSVIVPFYDETPFLAHALHSIASQGLDGVEIVVVNDNPERFGPQDFAAFDLPPGVRVLHHDRNAGLSAARNSGIAATTGQRIAFLDADDYYLAGGLAAQLAYAEQTGADLTHGCTCLSHVGSPTVTLLERDKALFSTQREGKGLTGLENAQFITSSWASIYRRDFLEGAGLRFDPAQRKFEDRLFVLQSVTAADRIACMGRPVRVWRRRGGSISVTRPDPGVHLLQVQLLEKCLAHMRAYGDRPDIPGRFLKREVFNTVSRLIWDTELLPALAGDADPAYQDLAARVVALLGEDRFGQQIFDDPVLRLVSRVGMKTRKGRISRKDFFALHDLLRQADFAAAAAYLGGLAPKPVARPALVGARGRRLILHLGMHKTGSTWLQGQLLAHRTALAAAGVLVPKTGLSPEVVNPVRAGGFPGHQGLLNAVRHQDSAVFAALGREIAQSPCRDVVISCENFLMPVSSDREAQLPDLLARLGGFDDVRCLAFVRRPDAGPEMFYREFVSNGARGGARSLPEFLVDYGTRLLDLPTLFAPFESFAGAPITLRDHDASARAGTHWAEFCAMADLGRLADWPAAPVGARYVTPDRDAIAAARLVNTLIADPDLRIRTLRAFFAMDLPQGPALSILPPADRISLIDTFLRLSGPWAAQRGYAPDLAALRHDVAAEDWYPQGGLSAMMLDRLQSARLQAELIEQRARPALRDTDPAPAEPPAAKAPVLHLRLRPWAARLARRAGLLPA